MTKKDFELIARLLDGRRPVNPHDLCYPHWEETCRLMSLELQITNPRFSNAVFLKACGVVPQGNQSDVIIPS